MDWQTGSAAAIVVVTAVAWVVRLARARTGRRNGTCGGGCGGCRR